MSEDTREYKELFCLITFTDDMEVFIVPYKEIGNPEMAEVVIPHEADGVLYGITCYITNLKNSDVAIMEMTVLRELKEIIYKVLTADTAAGGDAEGNGDDHE